MNRIRPKRAGSSHASTRGDTRRPMRPLAILALLLSSGLASANPPIRIAVAPFVGEKSSMSVARALTGRLADRGLDRVIAPGDFIATASFEPRAADIRRWAYNSAVDAVVVGRVSALAAGKESKEGGRRVETILRSGHSGAELGRHDLVLPAGADLDGTVDPLAIAILGELGYAESPSAGPASATSAAAVPTDTSGGSAVNGVSGSSSPSGGGGAFGLELSKSGFRSDAPIEIKSDEAEIFDRDDGRMLIFQRNVWVRQANVTLQSQRLEASYRKGESEPRELIAEGNVVIVQDDRRARCDRAVYQREANLLTCKGHAELIQGCDIVRGKSIVFDLASDQARVEGAASIVIQPEGTPVTECPIERDQP
jgi:lipopolysaccharide transport protein LptA